jgi:hypothetical protein
MASTPEPIRETEMILNPDLLLTQFHNQERELIAEADRRRLLAAVRRGRDARGATSAVLLAFLGRYGYHRNEAGRPTARGHPANTLAPWESRPAAPARAR